MIADRRSARKTAPRDDTSPGSPRAPPSTCSSSSCTSRRAAASPRRC
ncbi:MAG: hypothetical protein MZW92_46115 [Comamonadaceae bacterium]|nr:hypothetical protein [Comamonadaceae bacterium]